MNINELVNRYKLTKNDAWQLPQNKNLWIIKHSAIEKIMSFENIIIENINVVTSEWNFCRLVVTAVIKDRKIITIGEALLNTDEVIKTNKKGQQVTKGNCESQYIGAMAEKRGIDRAVLKLINAYEYDIKSECEADEFQQGDNK
jgi:hypothetical protein